MYYYNISSTQTDPLSTECLWSSSRTQTRHKAIAPHWSSSYPEYLSPDQDQGEQRRIVWSRLHDHRTNLANRLARTRDRYLEAHRALNPRTTQVESSHDPLYRDNADRIAQDHHLRTTDLVISDSGSYPVGFQPIVTKYDSAQCHA